MKLTDLEPRWFTFMAHPADGVDIRSGISFLCPHCMTQRLGVRFEPVIDKAGLMEKFHLLLPIDDKPTWHRDGDTFETLTLTPSIDASGFRVNMPEMIAFVGHWHGYITKGEVK
jgi:hypothetical protein